jgi:hypothetical protein
MAETINLTNDQINLEEQTRSSIARTLAERTERFNAQQPAVVATPEPTTPLAAALARLAAPAPIAPPRDLPSTQMQLAPLLSKARSLVRRFDELRDQIGDRANDYAALDMGRIVKLIPPTTDSENWARLNALINASKEIAGTLAASNYSSMTHLIGIAQRFHDGGITEYQDPRDRGKALYNPGVAIRYMEDQVKKFEVTVSALANNIQTVALMEPLIAADLVLVQAAPVVPEPAPERLAMHQKLPLETPKNSYVANYDPREPVPVKDESVKVEQVDGGTHITTVSRRAE